MLPWLPAGQGAEALGSGEEAVSAPATGGEAGDGTAGLDLVCLGVSGGGGVCGAFPFHLSVRCAGQGHIIIADARGGICRYESSSTYVTLGECLFLCFILLSALANWMHIEDFDCEGCTLRAVNVGFQLSEY